MEGRTIENDAFARTVQPSEPGKQAWGACPFAPGERPSEYRRRCAMWRGLGWTAVLCVVVALLHAWPGRSEIPPLIESDNAYIFSAADRMYAGYGPTTIPPKAPLQPWTWQGDWAFLTQWPVGYTALIFATRAVFGISSAQAGVTLGVAGCGLALVAWFAWFKTCLPCGLTALLLAIVAAGASFSVENLVEPSSDTVLLALLPLVLLLVRRAVGEAAGPQAPRAAHWAWMPAAGLACGLLFWIRYAAIFVPLAAGIYLLMEWRIFRRVKLPQVLAFALAALVPLVALWAVNQTYGMGASTRERFNLGSGVTFAFDPGMFVTAWNHFTRQTLYAHRPEAGWVFSLGLPIAALGGAMLLNRSRVNLRRWLGSPPMLLSIVLVVTLPVFLIVVTTLFHDKYDFVGLDRYYRPVRPFYFFLFVGALLSFEYRAIRALTCAGLVMTASWFVNQDALRTFNRWRAAQRPTTEYGRWARRFLPHSRELYAWVAEQGGDDLVIFSNYHDCVTLETGLPACPSPGDVEELDLWLSRIREVRGRQALRVYFVLDPDNDIRDYFLDPPEELVKRFNLIHPPDVPLELRPFIFAPDV